MSTLTPAAQSSPLRLIQWKQPIIWSLGFLLFCILARPVIQRLLPQTVEQRWMTTVALSANANVVIEGSRELGAIYTANRPLSAGLLRIEADDSSTRPVVLIGPNVSVCRYDNLAGQMVRGATPPDEKFLATWLGDCGLKAEKATAISDKAGELFDLDRLDHNTLSGDWVFAPRQRVSGLTQVVAAGMLLLIWGVGLAITLIPRPGLLPEMNAADPAAQ